MDKRYITGFNETAQDNGNSVAIIDQNGSRQTSYSELFDLQARVAGKIISLGLSAKTPVIIYMGRCMEYAAAFLGIQTAGCAVVPLTLEYPFARVDYIKNDCKAGLIITEDFFLDIDNYPKADMVETSPDSLAYLAYTSGSTGNPKGIVHTQRSLYRLTFGESDLYDIDGPLVMAAGSSFSFMICIYDMWRPLVMGCTIHIIDESVRKDVSSLSEYYSKNHITMGIVSPQMLKHFKCSSPDLKRVIAGGEILSMCHSSDFEIINVYGSSETGLTFCFRVDKKYQNTPIGKPFKDCEVKLIPQEGSDNPNVGELCVTGDFAGEYIGLLEKSSQTFEHRSDGRVIYHTGDIVESDENGNYIYHNRIDWMVKVNGQRVETMEIETLIKNMEGIDNAAVKAFVDNAGQTYLCAYYVSGKSLSEGMIRESLSKKLPGYMIPRFFVMMEKLPINISGKLDRLSLKEPSLDRFKEEYKAPENDKEKLICEAFERTLTCGRVGRDDDFMALGGDSIKVLKLIEEIEGSSPYSIKTSDVLRSRTPKILAECLIPKDVSERDTQNPAQIPSVSKLTEAQRGVYFECMESPESTKYNIPFAIELPKEIDVDRFVSAVIKVVSMHPAFSVCFSMKDGEPVMLVCADKDENPCYIGRMESDDLKELIDNFVRPFDIKKGPLYRFALVKRNDSAVFLMDIHHLIFDGTSLNIFLDQIASAYMGEDVKSEKITIFDVAGIEELNKASKEYNLSREFFAKELEGVDFEMNLIPDKSCDDPSEHSKMITKKFPVYFGTKALSDFAAKAGITESTLFLAAYAYTLGIFGGTKEVCFTTVNNGRHDSAMMNTIGMFVKSLPLHFNIDDKENIAEFLKDVQDKFYATMEHDDISFGELVQLYGVHTRTSFVYQSELLSEICIDSSTVLPKALPTPDCQADMLLMALKLESGFELQVQFRDDLYSDELMESFLETMIMVVSGMVESEPLTALSKIGLISERGREFIDRINSTQKAYDTSLTVNSLLDKAIRENGDGTALVYKDKKYTYLELDKITAGAAAIIAGKGIGTDDFVAVLAPRNDETVLAAWSVIRAGAGLVPLDPSYPSDRLNFMTKDCGAKLLIADRSLRPVLDEYEGDVLYTDEIMNRNFGEAVSSGTDSVKAAIPEGAIAMIYTSGTTGKPKGCVLENRNLVAFYYSHSDVMEIKPDSRIANYASFGFDAGLMDIITTALSGAALYIIPDEIRLDFARLEEFYCDNEITQGFMTTQVGRMFAAQTSCRSLKAFMVGGEKLVPFTPSDRFRFINGYGPCETMAYICHFDVKDNSKIQPIGTPSINTKLYVSDTNRRLLPVGAVGELGISGYQVSRGYLGRPEQTEAAFIANPFDKKKGYEKVYLTGDIVRLLPDGNLEYIGRRDHQVKIRGFRVELTEIEEIIRRFEDVEDATVCAFDDAAGGKFIAAYVVGCKDTQKLADFIRSEKPDYMVPASIMPIDKIPYTQNQKVNKRALPVPVISTETEIIRPSNETEQKLYDLAVSVLGHDNFGITTDLFAAGLTSIGMLRFNMEIAKCFDRAVSISDIKKSKTVKALAVFLTDDYADDGMNKPEKFEIMDKYPLRQNQKGVFIDATKTEDCLNYNIPVLFKLADSIDLNKLKDAIKQAGNAHPFIKAVLLTEENGDPYFVRNDDADFAVEVVKCSLLPKASELVRPFEIIGKELYRITLFDTDNGKYLFMDMHHLISDGTSIGIFISDISKAYLGNTISPETYTGFEAAALEIKDVNSEKYADAKAYYDGLLGGLNTECLPGKCPEINERSEEPIRKSGEIITKYDESSAQIFRFLEDNKLSANAFFNAVFSFTLARFLHTDDVTYCTIYNGRSDARFADTFAMMVQTLPVRMLITEKSNVTDFVRKIQTQLLDSMTNDSFPFMKICETYGVKPDVFFNYQGDNFDFDSICGEPAEMINPDTDEIKAPLSIEMSIQNVSGEKVFTSKLVYSTEMFCKEFAISFAESLKKCADDFAKKKELGQVSILPKSEKKLFDEMNDTGRAYENTAAFTFIERMAKEQPEKTAVKTGDATVTFGELNGRADILAALLAEKGIKKDEIIGVILERSEIVPIVELGVMKAGGAFLPMLPSYPDDRLLYCIKDAGCRYVITTGDIIETHKELLGENDLFEVIDAGACLSSSKHSDVYALSIPESAMYDGSALAYTIYTSGSTGTPKGVMIEHHNLSNFVQTSGLVDIEKKGSAILAMASISFDMSVTEIFFSLCQGNTVYIATEEEIHNLDRLLNAIIDNGIDIMMMTPSLAWSLLSLPEGSRAFSHLKGIVLGAEAFRPALYDKLKSLNPDMIIMNGYGPTECTQVCSAKVLYSGENVTIGKPFYNTKFYVTDTSGNLLPRYASGELLIVGDGVGRGYVGLPDKTAAAFLEVDGERAYRSGDLVRVNRDMEVEFGGRADNQVKIRGFRVELDEIENVMEEFDGVAQAKVVVRNNGTEDFLAGFFTAEDPSCRIDIDELKGFLKSKLTYYMVPQAMMQLDKMPMTINGKLDKKALPEIKPEKKARVKKAPKKSLEEKIVDMFKSVLNLDEVYVDDNFYEIGGTSLSASKVVMQLKSEGIEIEYQDIFDYQSPEELAEYLEDKVKPAASEAAKTEEEKLIDQDEEIAELLKYNTLEYADRVEREPLGTVFLTGAAGFLGCHILKDLLDNEEGRIICIMRKGRFNDVTTRLKAALVYYFENDFADDFDSRIMVIEGDITDDDLSSKLRDISFDTLINCAASVKHFANDDSIEFVNVHGVENLIRLTKSKNARMIQISTTSVPGAHNSETYKLNLRMKENQLFVIDDMNNQYCRSKYQAELKMLDAIKHGMKGKIIRVGNLMGRHSDGEFQTNMHTNAFLNGLKGFVAIGKCPISHSTDPMSFSPIDCTARAVVLLAGTNDCFTAFHAESRSTFDEMKVFESINRCGIKVRPVSDEEYYSDFYRMMGDSDKNEKVSALLTNDRPDIHMVYCDNRFSANILYRLGFSWPFIDDFYLDRVIKSLDELDFFGNN